jgi:hypothetical protein
MMMIVWPAKGRVVLVKGVERERQAKNRLDDDSLSQFLVHPSSFYCFQLKRLFYNMLCLLIYYDE